jgi:membrane fusion protein
MSSLFRQEAIDARRDSWLGVVQLVQPLPLQLVALVGASLMVAGVAFSVFGTYTRRVHAAGSILPKAGLITVGAPAAGLIGSMAAAEGQVVQKGQLLYVLDLDATSSSGPTQQRVIALLNNEKSVLQKSRELRLSLAAVEKQSLNDQLRNLSEQDATLTEQLAHDEATLPDAKAGTDRLRTAADRQLVTGSQFQNQNYAYSQLLALHAQFLQSAIAIKGKISEVTSALAGFDDKVATDVNEIDQRMAQLARQIAESEARQAVEVHAPESGLLTAIRGHVGQQVAAGAPLVTLLPQGGALEAHLYVDSAAIGFIREGAPVLLRYTAYPFQRFGLSQATVTEVTRAPIAEDELAGAGKTQASADRNALRQLYRVVAVPKLAYVVAYGEHKPLETGMQVDADIALDTRPLYQWMLDPLYHLRRSAGIVAGEGMQ